MDAWRIDGSKLDLHPARVAQWLEADTWEKAKRVYPIYWEITTSAACNHRCTFCSTDAIGYPAILMDADILNARMAETQRLGVKSVMFAGTGEPLLHRRISEITRSATDSGLDVAFTTNGILLDKLACVERATWIKVSMNAGTQATYAAVHRTDAKDWDRVWSGIRNAVKRKGNCTIGVQCVVLPENYKEMGWLAAQARDAGCDYLVLKPYSQATFMLSHQYEGTDYAAMHEFLQSVTAFDTDTFKVIYRQNAMRKEIDGAHGFDLCRATPFMWCYSMANGDLFTCSAHLLDPRFCIGNLNKNTFQELWEGERRRANYELMKSFDIGQCRLNCRMAGPNTYLAEFNRVRHQTFI